jgi:hypothetical protein
MRAKMAHPGGSKGNGRMSEPNARTAIVFKSRGVGVVARPPNVPSALASPGLRRFLVLLATL